LHNSSADQNLIYMF